MSDGKLTIKLLTLKDQYPEINWPDFIDAIAEEEIPIYASVPPDISYVIIGYAHTPMNRAKLTRAKFKNDREDSQIDYCIADGPITSHISGINLSKESIDVLKREEKVQQKKTDKVAILENSKRRIRINPVGFGIERFNITPIITEPGFYAHSAGEHHYTPKAQLINREDLFIESEDLYQVKKSLRRNDPVYAEIEQLTSKCLWMSDLLKEINLFAYENFSLISNATGDKKKEIEEKLFSFIPAELLEKRGKYFKKNFPRIFWNEKMNPKNFKHYKSAHFGKSPFTHYTPPTKTLLFINNYAKANELGLKTEGAISGLKAELKYDALNEITDVIIPITRTNYKNKN